MRGMEEISLVLDTAYGVRYEALANFRQSIFRDVYNSASSMVQEIIERNIEAEKQNYSRGKDEQICNVVAILGERGGGKSSVLASYCKALEELNHYNPRANGGNSDLDEEQSALFQMRKNKEIFFGVLDSIDATMLENDEKIISIILARMLEKVEEKKRFYEMSRGNKDEIESLGRKIEYKIGEMYKNLDKRFKEEIDSPALMVKELSNSWNLREAFIKLAEDLGEYLSYESGGRNDNYYIVIPIDDIDMNIGKCWDMLEMIRKYLMVPKVILLLTFHYEQLYTVCRLHYYQELQKNEKLCGEGYAKEQAENLAKEYMEKVIPTGRKIYMPRLYQLESEMKKQIKIEGTKPEGWKKISMEPERFVRAMLRFYTGIFLDESRSNYIYPPSIRKLNNFVKEFRQLKILDKKEPSENGKNFIYNLDWMYRDVTNRFLEQYIEDKERRMIQGYLDAGPAEQNHALSELILDRISGGNEKWKMMVKYLANKEWLSYGDHLILLHILKKFRLETEKNNILIWDLLISLKMTRECYGKIYGINDSGDLKQAEENKHRDYFKDYLTEDLWGDWERWYWCYREGDTKPVTMEVDGDSSSIEVGSVIDSEIKDDNEDVKKEKYQRLIETYLIIRIFFDCYDGVRDNQEEKEVPLQIGKGLYLRLSSDKSWKFRIGNLISFIWNYEEKLNLFSKELHKQCLEPDLDKLIDGVIGDWRNKLNKWKEKDCRRDIIPFASTMFMERIFERFYKENEMKVVSNIEAEVKGMLKTIEGELERVDNLVKWDEVVNIKEGEDCCLMILLYRETFKKCPIVSALRGEEGYGELSEQIYRSLSNVLESFANERYASEAEESATSPS